ncbi:MAG: sugar phosphate isomerase/epimerase family protein [Lentisphaeria bacterium]|jgi:sugar phosphate isomerase/epimerase|nr:sugar phosphate isomerase/epimerase family protein [Lentisphaeria bacterium]
MAFRFGCNTLYPHGRLPSEETVFDLAAHRESLALIRSCGFDGCEFSHYQHLQPEEQTALRAVCAELGLIPSSAHSWVPLPGAVANVAAALPRLHASLAGAARLGVSVMVLHAAGGEADDRRNALGQTLRDLAPAAEKAGITLAIENCSSRADLEFLIATVDALALPAVGFNIDTGHAVLHGMTPAEAIRLMGRRLVTTHLQDNFGKRDDHLPPGKGTIDWVATRDALLEVRYQGMFMVEISDCPPEREPLPREDTQAAHDFLHKLFGIRA